LTRRANHRHIVSLPAIDRTNRARAGNPAAAFCAEASAQKNLKLSAIAARHVREECSEDRKNEHPDRARSAASVTSALGFVGFVQKKSRSRDL
jgi:hypothetical protein